MNTYASHTNIDTTWEAALQDITTLRDRGSTKWYLSGGHAAVRAEAAYLGPGLVRPAEDYYAQTNTVTNWTNNTWTQQADPNNWHATGSVTLGGITRTYMRYYDYITGATRRAVTETNYARYLYAENQGWDTTFVEFMPKSPGERLREIIRARTAPQIVVKKVLSTVHDLREKRARQTLRRILGSQRYERFLSRGFVTAQGRSGLWYQIFPGHEFTTVWKDGKVLNRLCVVMDGNFCPTDSLIMRYVLITSDEERFRRLANTQSAYRPAPRIITPQQGSLVELAKSVGFRKAESLSA